MSRTSFEVILSSYSAPLVVALNGCDADRRWQRWRRSCEGRAKDVHAQLGQGPKRSAAWLVSFVLAASCSGLSPHCATRRLPVLSQGLPHYPLLRSISLWLC
ncbi:hypothetical protein L1887_53013 [Cichorium endivia]|nr:hypothetical protein L1887_53013 [Cichorium endivia]